LEGFFSVGASAKPLESEQTDSGEVWDCHETGESASSWRKHFEQNEKKTISDTSNVWQHNSKL